jgi:hypothetical protein
VTQVRIRSPHGGSHDYDVVDPSTSALRTVRFERGVATLDADDPAVLVFAGMATRGAYTVETIEAVA